MRRGLIARSLVELPDAVFDARLDRVRAAMRVAQLDALVIYTNNTRPAGVSWLVGFVPYWSEAVLVVPREGGPYLVAALSFREALSEILGGLGVSDRERERIAGMIGAGNAWRVYGLPAPDPQLSRRFNPIVAGGVCRLAPCRGVRPAASSRRRGLTSVLHVACGSRRGRRSGS